MRGRVHSDQLDARLLEADVHGLLAQTLPDVVKGLAEFIQALGHEADNDRANRFPAHPPAGIEPATLLRLAQRGAAEGDHQRWPTPRTGGGRWRPGAAPVSTL